MAKPEEYTVRKAQLAGWPVSIVTYRLGFIYHTAIHNADPGAWVAKAEGSTKEEAQSNALKEAEGLLAKVKTSPVPTGCKSIPGF